MIYGLNRAKGLLYFPRFSGIIGASAMACAGSLGAGHEKAAEISFSTGIQNDISCGT
jgi:hypothetical protein